MTLTAEQILASHKANIETLFGLTTKAFEGVEKLVELNVTASRAALTEAASHTQAVLGVKDAQELLALQASLFQPLAEKTAAYSRHLYDIASGTGAEFGKAFEAKTADAQKAFTNLVDSAAKNAPAGSETAVAMMKSTVSAANNAFESVQKAVKQASDVAEANPLQLFLDSLLRYLDLPENTLVLPSHGKPFTGLATRIAQLQDHHRERLEEILLAARDHALSATDTLPILFKRKLDTHQMTFAMGEALAHLHYLWMEGKLERFLDQNGVQRFRAAS